MSSIQLSSLTYRYPDSNTLALDHLDLEIQEGEFVLIVGGSGSGKSTLLRAIKGLIPRFHGGKITGEIKTCNKNEIGMVFQNPEDQIVFTQVEEEIVFGMENLGLPRTIMKRRKMEVSDSLGLSELVSRDVNTLSGGQLQKIALASILCTQPNLLLLDEPTSQLDPFAGEDILTLVKRLNEDNGMTVLLVEQRLERCIHLADRIIYMDQGKISLDTKDLSEALSFMSKKGKSCIHPVGYAFSKAGISKIPLTVKEGRNILRKWNTSHSDFYQSHRKEDINITDSVFIKVQNLSFHYPGEHDILQKVCLELKRNAITTMLGENGAGKTTLLKLLAGILKPCKGTVYIDGAIQKGASAETLVGTIGYLSQNPNDYLMHDTVNQEIRFSLEKIHLPWESGHDDLLKVLGIEGLLEKHPRDLSVGERQRVALASVLVMKPKMLLLDEPTRGLDYSAKLALGEYLKTLRERGIGIFLITHDIEFASEFSDEVLIFSRGEIVSSGRRDEVLSNSIFYSSQISKLFRGFVENIVRTEDAIRILSDIRERNI